MRKQHSMPRHIPRRVASDPPAYDDPPSAGARQAFRRARTAQGHPARHEDDMPPGIIRTSVPTDAPRSVQYEDQSARAYLVWEDDAGQRVRVPKQRSVVPAYPPDSWRRSADIRLLRWSGLALGSVLLGGVGGIVFGLLTASLAALLLLRHGSRVRAWRRAHRAARGAPDAAPVPAAASADRARLRTALWQGLLAAALGVVFLLALLDRLP